MQAASHKGSSINQVKPTLDLSVLMARPPQPPRTAVPRSGSANGIRSKRFQRFGYGLMLLGLDL